MPGRGFRIGGLAILILVHASFVFLLVYPLVPNPLGRARDQAFLQDLDRRIQKTRTGEFTVTLLGPDGAPLPNRKLEYELVRHDFIFGCNIFEFDRFEDPEDNRKYREHFADLFNLAVLPFYWRRYEPERGSRPTDAWLERVLGWCEERGITPKGHPLSWRNPSGVPRWLDPDQAGAVDALRGRIQREVTRYRGRIAIWDVVNEPTHLPTFGGQTRFDYVSNALFWARAADPAARLTVNDYGILGRDYGSGPYFELLKQLLDTGAPLEIIGFESHEPRTDWIPAVEIWETLEAYSVLGLPIHSTEITVPSGGLPITNSWIKGLWTEERQAEYLERFYKTLFAHPAVEGVIYWDLYDGRAWVQKGGLIGEDFAPKEAYRRLWRLIHGDWHTRGETVTNLRGRIQFRGFYGTYRIGVPGTDRSFGIRALRDGSTEFSLRLPG